MSYVSQAIPPLVNINIFEAATIATLLVSGYIAYRSKANSLTNSREEERFLNDRLQEAKFVEEPFIVSIDRVEVKEKESRWYKLKRLALRPFEGKTLVTVRWDHHSVGEGVWESKYMDLLSEPFDFDIEHIQTGQVADAGVSTFELKTLDSDEIGKFAAALPRFARVVVEDNDHLEIEPVRSPFQLK